MFLSLLVPFSKPPPFTRPPLFRFILNKYWCVVWCMGDFLSAMDLHFFILHMKLNVNTQNSGEVSVLWLALVKSHDLRQVWIWNLTLPHFSAGKYSKKGSCLQTHRAMKQLVRVHPTQTASWNNNSYREVCDDIRSLWMTHFVLKFFLLSPGLQVLKYL